MPISFKTSCTWRRVHRFDEPTCGISPAETGRAVTKIRDLAWAIDLVVTEHDMDIVFGIADDITVLAQEAILAIGSPAVQQSSSPAVQQSSSPAAIADDERSRKA